MKRAGFFLAILLSVSASLAAAGNDVSNYFRTDSALVFRWNTTDQTWEPSQIQLYNYSDGRLISLLSVDYSTRAYLSKSEYLYNVNNLLETLTNYYYSGGWVTSTRNLYSYDTQSRISDIKVQKWVSSDWVTDRYQYNYLYDITGRQLEFQTIYWRSNSWTDPKTEYSYYDDEGKLIKREAIYYTGSTDYRIIYSYDIEDLLDSSYAEYPAPAGGWTNWWLINYQYNNCGMKTSQIQYTGKDTTWIPATKTVYFTHFDDQLYPYRKVPICHNRHTIYVHRSAVKAHLAHGDCIGSCVSERAESIRDNENVCRRGQQSYLKVFPNPASSYFKISLVDKEYEIRSIELYDNSGRLVRVLKASCDGDVTVYRQGLISGTYYLRVNGNADVVALVVFK